MSHSKSALVGIAAVTLGFIAVPIAIAVFVRPFDRPEYVDIDTSESAFLIPLEGDAADQAAFPSLNYLQERKIATKRVQLPHRWTPTGFAPAAGTWLPTVRLVKLDRRPITREWTKSAHTGTSTRDQAVSVETKDSVNFSVGISCTANIPEESAATFLYSYPAKSLAEMMDLEVRARIQQVVAEESAKYDLDTVRAQKNEIMAAVRADAIPFFKEKGLQITTIAMLGGITFDNPEIQRAIDDAAKTSQLKVAAESKREAQEIENKTIRLAAEGKATAAKLLAQGELETETLKADSQSQLKRKLAIAEADAEVAKMEAQIKVKKQMAEAEADSIRKVAEARAYEASKIQESPAAYLQLRAIEAEIQRWKMWDGKYPLYWLQMGGGSNAPATTMILPPLPGPEAAKKSAQVEK